MTHRTRLKLLAVALTVVVFGVLVLSAARENRAAPLPLEPRERGWPMFGGSAQRNMVNLTERNIPHEFDPVNGVGVKWTANLGSKAHGGPTIADGKVFVGTNNDNPRNLAIRGDKGVVMCFRESDGKFLWQAVHDKLAAGRVNDWPREGIVSSPAVEGKRLYYVSNRCELVCADTEGDQDKGEAKFLWKLDMIKELGVFPHNLATCSPLIVSDTVFVVTSNGVDAGHINIPAPDAPSFLGVNKRSGEVKWSSNLPYK